MEKEISNEIHLSVYIHGFHHPLDH